MLAPLHHWWPADNPYHGQSWCPLVESVPHRSTNTKAIQVSCNIHISRLSKNLNHHLTGLRHETRTPHPCRHHPRHSSVATKQEQSGAKTVWLPKASPSSALVNLLLWNQCKSIILYSSEELCLIITYFLLVWSKKSDIFIVLFILLYFNFLRRCFMHPS